MRSRRMCQRISAAYSDTATSGLGLQWMQRRNLFLHSWWETETPKAQRCSLTILPLALLIGYNLQRMGIRFILKRLRELLDVMLITRCLLRCTSQAKKKHDTVQQAVPDASNDDHREA